MADLVCSPTSIICTGSNTISGTLADIPSSVITFDIRGSNTISGDIADVDTTLYNFILTGSGVTDYSGKTWHATQNYFYFLPAGGAGLSTVEVDALLIDIDSDCAFSGFYKLINLTGTNAAPSGASAAARASLIAKGVSLTTN